MPLSVEGRVLHQKRNQTITSQWRVGFVFGFQLGYSDRLKSIPSYGEYPPLIVIFNFDGSQLL